MVEFAFLVPVIMLLATVIPLMLGLILLGHEVAQSAARQGVEAARFYGATDTDGQQAATDYLHAVAPTFLTAATVDVHRTSSTVTVQVRAQTRTVLPGTHWVQATASGPIERFTAAPG